MKKKALSIILSFAIALCSVNTTVFATVNNSGSAPVNLQVPNLAYDDDSITLIWEKGDNYENIVDYNVYENGKLLGSAKENFAENSRFTNAYIQAFYEGDTEKQQTKIQNLSYKVKNLMPDTEYSFTVKGVLTDGSETEASNVVTQRTSSKQQEFNIVDFGAKDTGRITDYTGREEEIKENTKAIQNTIDACTDGGKVVIPAGTYTSGSLWLKSNITIELEEGAVLSGSTNASDYEQNYLLRNYSTDRRTWGLLNAYTEDDSISNIRIVGEGIIDGNGWKYDHNGTYTTEPAYQKKDALDPAGEEFNLPIYAYGSNQKVYVENDESNTYGLLAADAVKKALADGYSRSDAYSTRPTLMIMKGVEGVYLEDITVTNPAFHGMSFGDCENVVLNSVKDFTYGNNNGDGIGIDSTRNCLVFNCTFDTGDDAINFASGLGNLSSYNKPASNIRIFNNFVRESHGGIIAAGSHTGAWIENILAEDNVSNRSDVPFRFKSAPVNGGGVRNVTIRDNAVANPKDQAFMFTTQYNDPNQILKFEASEKVAEFSNVNVKNVTVSTDTSANAIKVQGAITDGHNNLNFDGVKFINFTKGNSIQGLNDSTFNNVVFTGSTPSDKDKWIITDSDGLQFTGTTGEIGSIADAKVKPVWNSDAKVTADVKSQSVDLAWTPAQDNVGVTKYIVKTYLGDELLHEASVDGAANYTESGLMPSLSYKFVVEAEDATGNRTNNGPQVMVTTLADEKVTTGVIAPEDKNVTIAANIGYTWTAIKFNACTGDNVRKYEIYSNGTKIKELLNPELTGVTKDGVVTTSIGGLDQGTDNMVTVKALDDKGNTVEYNPVTIRTWDKFDNEAPKWESGSKLTAVVDGNTVKLSWPKASDDNEILGYRVYANGKVQGDGEFNQVNRTCTTTDTSYEIKDLEPGTYTFKVEAGDTWWRSASTEKSIAAPTNWSGKGPSVTVELKSSEDGQTTNPGEDNSNAEQPANPGEDNSNAEQPANPGEDNGNAEQPANPGEDNGNAGQLNNQNQDNGNDKPNKSSAKTGDKVVLAVAGLAALMAVSVGCMFLAKKKEN